MCKVFLPFFVMAAISCSHTQRHVQYFPPEFDKQNISSYLRALNQPSLYGMRQSNDSESHIRLIGFGRYDNPLVYWIRIDEEGTEHYVIQQGSPQKPSDQERNLQISVDIRFTGDCELPRLMIQRLGIYYQSFWDEPTTNDLFGSGGLYILEVLDRGKYHVIRRMPLTPNDHYLLLQHEDDNDLTRRLRETAARDWMFIEFIEKIQLEALRAWSDWPVGLYLYGMETGLNEWWMVEREGGIGVRGNRGQAPRIKKRNDAVGGGVKSRESLIESGGAAESGGGCCWRP